MQCLGVLEMLNLYSYAQHNYQLVKPKLSLCIEDLLNIPKDQVTEEDLRSLLRHLKYERVRGNQYGRVAVRLYEYFNINNIDLL